ncbi:MAG: phospho-N-acetylmuramoyl-pentapeptide-transferase [Bdellovibrionales bacterium RIFOXYD12_FULL_39_22]|nr:MAG: phospho-N-acetylmuramoyl-pentapeptide-transferase [Bdellovibrionales bacterium RIFOXYB1_FULL_39_21]OFZ41979.1 MAG: phospho-N-acetylmuramoyl-pentapeptide-transferase [Bdellovibrionales bacterium RIFOXYC12_FULL_39_17]OFZ50695.1 MAG: phospho-N-acetylmuramoyl-pentapeptide-transferase [Bdellovibrionales bacterium RIFOXYC1_FULL_39_130]OFZ76443.1 MAG: phospho-N-acetylmuramoyl-pentapeptide-transferase [Bdellovibrionales bacterium RIFOXYC2_FULL_39_8]OFZ77918.1 MAG: phospho-N-acetylmuramoyl-penta
MLYHFLYPLTQSIGGPTIFRYITFRAFFAFMLAIVISIFWGKRFIAFMKRKQFGQVIRTDGPETHFKKAGTPTMGGVVILGTIFSTTAICGNFLSLPVLMTLFVAISLFILGYIDDYLKVLKKNTNGISARGKLAWQILTAAIFAIVLIQNDVIDTALYLPFYKGPFIDMKYLAIPFIIFVIVGSSNAVNLTDGLDGLAIGPIITSAASLGLLAYVGGHREIASYLFIPYVENVGELLVVAAATIGAGVGFLWYNSYPAEVFMGDVGSLSLGGILASIAIATRNEVLFVIIGGIFVVEAVSVILQVGSYKLRQKRIFKMAPIHHHFELKGWPETKVIVRFWIISIFLAIFAIATLKLR